jgi:hypothetical protein
MAVPNHKKFSVVQFREDNSIAAVPSTWITEEDTVQYCRWPKGTQVINLIKNPASTPRSTWKRLQIKIFNSFGNGKSQFSYNFKFYLS